MSAFIHKPKGRLEKFDAMPNTRAWDALWAAAKAQPWWDDSLGYVGHDGEYWYFQKWGTTTGFARVKREA